MTIHIFIHSDGNKILEVQAEQHIEENDTIVINEFRNVVWEHCDNQHCHTTDVDGTCLTSNGVPCSEEHSYGENHTYGEN